MRLPDEPGRSRSRPSLAGQVACRRGGRLPLLVAVTFAVTLALGLWLYAMRQPTDGFFSSPLGVVGVALGVAAGQVIATLIARRHLRR
jgi:hypothetical protein